MNCGHLRRPPCFSTGFRYTFNTQPIWLPVNRIIICQVPTLHWKRKCPLDVGWKVGDRIPRAGDVRQIMKTSTGNRKSSLSSLSSSWPCGYRLYCSAFHNWTLILLIVIIVVSISIVVGKLIDNIQHFTRVVINSLLKAKKKKYLSSSSDFFSVTLDKFE